MGNWLGTADDGRALQMKLGPTENGRALYVTSIYTDDTRALPANPFFPIRLQGPVVNL